ncbi:MAG: TRAP transporter substrate-binding protein [Clostridiales Family XIII bacterium]|jgi:TRAP-type C4-dicarboxylate transport system substrate-binding protein|nr:TRAP transporter substrate-binding protein [Clostridiales Family XIII bacterium]
MKRKLGNVFLICLLLAMLIAVTACGGSGGDENAGSDEGDAGNAADSGSVADDPGIVLHFGSAVTPQDAAYPAIIGFAEELTEASGGSIEVVTDLNGVLGSDRDITEAVLNGDIAMAFMADISVASAIPEVGFVNLPYLFPTREDAIETYYNGWIGEKYRELLEQNGLKIVGNFMESDFRWMSNSKRPIQSAEDLAGLKMRVPEVPMYVSFFTKLGCTPVGMGINEVAAALQQKVIDGQDNGPIITHSRGFHEFQPYFTKTNHAYACTNFIMNPAIFDSMTPQQQELLLEMADKWTAQCQEDTIESVDIKVKQMMDSGMEVIDVTPELDAFIKKCAQEVWADDDICKNYPDDVMERIRSEFATS